MGGALLCGTKLDELIDVGGGTKLDELDDVEGGTKLDELIDVEGGTKLDELNDVEGGTKLDELDDVEGGSTVIQRVGDTKPGGEGEELQQTWVVCGGDGWAAVGLGSG